MPKVARARRGYTEADRQHFAGYVADRARLRPVECSGGFECWVEFGPPCIRGVQCLGCGGTPEVAPGDRMKRGARYAR